MNELVVKLSVQRNFWGLRQCEDETGNGDAIMGMNKYQRGCFVEKQGISMWGGACIIFYSAR